MSLKKILALLVIMVPILGMNAQQTKLLTAEKHNEYGLVYTLPETMFRIDVKVEKRVDKRGAFYQFAKKYIGTNNVVTEPGEQWRITEVNLTPIGVADMSAQYLMRTKAGQPLSICVAKDNMLLSINSSDVEYTQPEEVATPMHVVKEGEDVEAFLQYMGEDYVASQSMAKKAQYLSESMLEIRESRNALVRGTADNVPTDGKQLELMLNNMQQQESSMMAAFTGSTTIYEGIYSYYYTPNEAGKETLFRMSDFAGPVSADNYAGEEVNLEIKILGAPKLPVDAKGEEKKLPKDAVIYNIPGRAEVSITQSGERLYYNPAIDVAQFGVQFGLDPLIFIDKKSPAFATFNPVTGAIEDMGSVKEPIAPEN